MNYYFDTSALIKMYHREKGTDYVVELFEDTNSQNYISQIAFIEFSCSLYRKLRNGEILHEEDVIHAIQSFDVDMQYENIVLLEDAFFIEAKNLIRKLGRSFSLKTLDSIHLACFIQLTVLGEIIFVSSDKGLCTIVSHLGYPTVNPG